LEEVKSLIHSGNRHEKENRFAFALADYQEALRLDPSSVEAKDAAARVKERIADQQFQQLMSLGFSFLHDGKYERAREAFGKAAAFEPESAEAQDALSQVEQAIRLARISELKEEASAAEQAENWEQASAIYQAVLAINPAIQFAVRGKERCLERIQIRNRIQVYLEKPGLLESQGHLEDAVRLLNQATALPDRGQKLTALIFELERLVQGAKTPIQVVLLSDNLTDVSVYRVGRFGKFHRLIVDLRPGTYRAVGSRVGYKDVRQEIVVTAGEEPAPVTIRCEEKI
jgi:tetratricopeptide (TPR) repeat protein